MFFQIINYIFSLVLKYIFLKGYSQINLFEVRSCSFFKFHKEIYVSREFFRLNT